MLAPATAQLAVAPSSCWTTRYLAVGAHAGGSALRVWVVPPWVSIWNTSTWSVPDTREPPHWTTVLSNGRLALLPTPASAVVAVVDAASTWYAVKTARWFEAVASGRMSCSTVPGSLGVTI